MSKLFLPAEKITLLDGLSARKISIFYDADNVSIALYPEIVQFLERHGRIVNSNVYCLAQSAGSPEMCHVSEKFQFTLHTTPSATRKNASDLLLLDDMYRIAWKEKGTDMMVLVSSDGDYSKAVQSFIRDEIYVLGIGTQEASERLARECSGYINLEARPESSEVKSASKTAPSQAPSLEKQEAPQGATPKESLSNTNAPEPSKPADKKNSQAPKSPAQSAGVKMRYGYILKLIEQHEYGFIKCDGSPDEWFFSFRDLTIPETAQTLRKGMEVTFLPEREPNPKAQEIDLKRGRASCISPLYNGIEQNKK